ncbi:hypothetical protein Xcel_2331 [Xylanimonas cellulosilytica DSM 15894]|uniref:Uncharacterized protein n=1 Tax=Xylanimonas cellulosilytica (strain DSM 15894 / JCM 12276 / CECT 5975 / KCTC 9989 / LMG 20990 / NBRC 107835 / XIL07) TaxID=446471 RepID=D1BVM9_XYLCX|nr:hypothetical protein [Xylanimonas cellulosilytica]ACZ31348.1 hypothetical protein Xcel_2331 [Xylanimonas cellulosilytica DSM 15894]
MITLAWMLFWRIGLAYVRFAQSVYPSNLIIRWAHRPGRVRYGWPLCGVLWFAYWRLLLWLQTVGPPDTADRPWWLYLATLAAAISAYKFMGAFVFWLPAVTVARAVRRVRRAAAARIDAWRVRRLATR